MADTARGQEFIDLIAELLTDWRDEPVNREALDWDPLRPSFLALEKHLLKRRHQLDPLFLEGVMDLIDGTTEDQFRARMQRLAKAELAALEQHQQLVMEALELFLVAESPRSARARLEPFVDESSAGRRAERYAEVLASCRALSRALEQATPETILAAFRSSADARSWALVLDVAWPSEEATFSSALGDHVLAELEQADRSRSEQPWKDYCAARLAVAGYLSSAAG